MENAQLTVQDLAALHSILETACNRGVFKAGELRQVGEVYEKLTHFLKTLQEQTARQGEVQDSSGEASPTTQGETNA